MTDFNLSVSDLIQVDGFKEAFGAGDMEKVKAHLYHNGMDTDKPYEIVRVIHRNLRNQVVNVERFEGLERLDQKWIKSGYASLEAQIESVEDDNLRFNLRTMSVQRAQDKYFD